MTDEGPSPHHRAQRHSVASPRAVVGGRQCSHMILGGLLTLSALAEGPVHVHRTAPPPMGPLDGVAVSAPVATVLWVAAMVSMEVDVRLLAHPNHVAGSRGTMLSPRHRARQGGMGGPLALMRVRVAAGVATIVLIVLGLAVDSAEMGEDLMRGVPFRVGEAISQILLLPHVVIFVREHLVCLLAQLHDLLNARSLVREVLEGLVRDGLVEVKGDDVAHGPHRSGALAAA
mmetsp:Transcript_21565/g.45915  ORF Transcript_21565/g.45915 Transcript_21565/m.45915 type:complete len:230 (+) Transcript_21565:205-894(+)